MKSVFCFILVCLVLSAPSFSQYKFITTRNGYSSSDLYLYAHDSLKKVYEDQNRVFFEWDIKGSHENKLFGAISQSRGFIQTESNEPYIDQKLLVFSSDGKMLRMINDVQRYAWSPDSRMIVYILGRQTEGFGFRASSLGVMNVTTGKQRTIEKGVKYQDIDWAIHDSLLYATDFSTTYRINPKSGLRARVPYKGIFFSPDGKYYYEPNYEGGGFGLYHTESSADITPKYLDKYRVGFNKWLGNDLVLVGDIIKEKKIIDAGTGISKESIFGVVIGYNRITREIYVRTGEKGTKESPGANIEKIKIGK